jgi:hypothetical protein
LLHLRRPRIIDSSEESGCRAISIREIRILANRTTASGIAKTSGSSSAEKAWLVAVLKAHGVDPKWRKGSYKDLTAEGQQRFREINLHWHDLRHEYASRLVERGVPLAQVRDLLGHASIVTTERYDNQRLEALQAAVARLEEGKTFDRDRVSRNFQVPTERSLCRRLRNLERNPQK